MARPKQIELTLKEQEAFKDRINNSNLDGNDKDISGLPEACID